MRSLHTLLDNLIAAGSISGWRIDAILLGSLLWAVSAGYAQLRVATA
jgi:hypothetical protein